MYTIIWNSSQSALSKDTESSQHRTSKPASYVFFSSFQLLCMLVHVGRQIVEMCASSTSKRWKRHTHIVCLFFFWQTEKLISTLSQGALGKAWKGRVRVYDAIACMMFARTFQRGVKGACWRLATHVLWLQRARSTFEGKKKINIANEMRCLMFSISKVFVFVCFFTETSIVCEGSAQTHPLLFYSHRSFDSFVAGINRQSLSALSHIRFFLFTMFC